MYDCKDETKLLYPVTEANLSNDSAYRSEKSSFNRTPLTFLKDISKDCFMMQPITMYHAMFSSSSSTSNQEDFELILKLNRVVSRRPKYSTCPFLNSFQNECNKVIHPSLRVYLLAFNNLFSRPDEDSSIEDYCAYYRFELLSTLYSPEAFVILLDETTNEIVLNLGTIQHKRLSHLYQYIENYSKLTPCTIISEDLSMLTLLNIGSLVASIDAGALSFPNDIVNKISTFDAIRRVLTAACERDMFDMILDPPTNSSYDSDMDRRILFYHRLLAHRLRGFVGSCFLSKHSIDKRYIYLANRLVFWRQPVDAIVRAMLLKSLKNVDFLIGHEKEFVKLLLCWYWEEGYQEIREISLFVMHQLKSILMIKHKVSPIDD
jgi:hypothetical protein